MAPVIQVDDLRHAYGDRIALDGLDIEIESGQIFAILGPNGSGKTTLFRILSTLLRPQSGGVKICGESVSEAQSAVRSNIGIVFQSASLDKKLTVLENIRCQAALYGLSGSELRNRENELLGQLGLRDRTNDYAETLSGGLKRRVELAKGMIHRPKLLLLDEPTTGLDPGARADVWDYLRRLRDEFGVSVVLTTHLLEEAERADQIAIMNAGRTVITGAPNALCEQAGDTTITIECDQPEQLAPQVKDKFQCELTILDRQIRVKAQGSAINVGDLMDAFPSTIKAVRVGRPTLEDVFVAHTGHQFWQSDGEEDSNVN